MNNYANTASSQGLLKNVYPDGSRNQEVVQSLRNRQKELEQKVASQMPNPELGMNAAAAFPVSKAVGAMGSPGRTTPLSKNQPIRR